MGTDKKEHKTDKFLVVLTLVVFFMATTSTGIMMFMKQLVDGTDATAPANSDAVEYAETISEPKEEFFVEIVEDKPEDAEPAIKTEPFICVSQYPVRCYQYPDPSSAVIERFKRYDTIPVAGEEEDFYLCILESGEAGYIKKTHLSNTGYAYPFVEIPDAQDLRLLIPDAQFDMLFASENNITGHAMYPAIPVLETTTANKLAAAADIFRSDGYILKIYDAYRPKSAQYELYDIVNDNRYIANPHNGNSWHNVGRAVDMSLICVETGEELEMPTPMHTFNSDASRFNSSRWTETAKANVEYMTNVMTSVGFGTISTEWWHFEYTGHGGYLSTNLELDAREYILQD